MSTNSSIPIDNLLIKDILRVDGAENMGGMTTKGYILLGTHIETFPELTPIDTVSDISKLVTLTGEYVMKDGKYAIEVDTILDTANLSYENQGEAEGHSFHPSAEFKLPGATVADKLAWARILNNSLGVFISVDNYGQRIVLGDQNRLAKFTPSGNTGSTPAERSEIIFKVEWDSFCPAMIYTGAIPLAPTT